MKRLLNWPLAVVLGVSVCGAQVGPDQLERDQAEEARLRSEHELELHFQRILEARRQAAHDRLADEAATLQSQALCPVFDLQSPEPPSFRKQVPGPFRARFAPPARPPWRGVAPPGESAIDVFSDYISIPVVQSKCIYCHVQGGASGHTRLVLVPQDAEGHEATNLAVFQNFLDTVEGGADLILNKIQGAEAHGGGVQVVAGSEEFANMERFLRALGGETTSGPLSPETLFDGVTMAAPARTLRRAALLFAGRLPTQAELAAVRYGGESSLRRTIRGLMTGPGFHDFLIRSSNDRLLTDRERNEAIRNAEVRFVVLTNKRWELADEAVRNGYQRLGRYPPYRFYQNAVHYGVARAPLELIAHVVENDLPYTEILTADYIMANPVAAAAYDANTEFENPEDPTEFRPSEIVGYYRRDRSLVVEYDPLRGRRVIDPGNLRTDYPHAGILNTTVFLKRYPTTPTNRNRARSRWTYYHFLGFDIEQSAARTTNPVALADTNNPTMHNPACTVCHIPMDPVAGAFQNYGNVGMYRDQTGGRDSLPKLYKYPTDGSTSPYQRGDTWFRDMREPGIGGRTAPSADNSLQWLAEQIVADERFANAAVRFWWPAVMGVGLIDPPTDATDSDFNERLVASSAQALEVGALAESFRNGFGAGRQPYNAKDLLVEIALSPWFRAESVTGDDETRMAALEDAGVARLLTPEELASKTDAIAGYVWGRRFQQPFGLAEPTSKLHDPQAYSGYQLLYGGIDSDAITERTGDMTAVMASVAQSHAAEVSCPIVRREFYYWPETDRMLFDGITRFDTPHSETTERFDVTAESADSQQLVALDVLLSAGSKTVRLAYTNNSTPELQDSDGNRLDRNLNLGRLVVRDLGGAIVSEVELKTLPRQRCGRPRRGFYYMNRNCSLEVPFAVPTDGMYRVEISAYQERAGDAAARLEVEVGSLDGGSRGETAIRRKLADLHRKLYGVTVAVDSPDVNEAFDLFVEAWNSRRSSTGSGFFGGQLTCSETADHLYYEALVPDALLFGDGGGSRIDADLLRQFRRDTAISDSNHIVEAWVVTLGYLLTDYRYLYF